MNARFSHEEGYTDDWDEEIKAQLVDCDDCGQKRHPEFGGCDCDIPEDVRHFR